MPDLLHEYWTNEDNSSQFGVVRAYNDEVRPSMAPDARLVFSLRAPSWHQAMKLYHERLGYGEYRAPKGELDLVYTDEEKAEQDRYLLVRKVS